MAAFDGGVQICEFKVPKWMSKLGTPSKVGQKMAVFWPFIHFNCHFGPPKLKIWINLIVEKFIACPGLVNHGQMPKFFKINISAHTTAAPLQCWQSTPINPSFDGLVRLCGRAFPPVLFCCTAALAVYVLAGTLAKMLQNRKLRSCNMITYEEWFFK